MQTIAQYHDLLAIVWGLTCMVGDKVHDLLKQRRK